MSLSEERLDDGSVRMIRGNATTEMPGKNSEGFNCACGGRDKFWALIAASLERGDSKHLAVEIASLAYPEIIVDDVYQLLSEAEKISGGVSLSLRRKIEEVKIERFS
jgi:hypothetical protein